MAKRKRKVAPLHVVIRAVVRHAMPADAIRLLLDRAIHEASPNVSGLKIVGLDWSKGRSESSTDETGDVRGAMRDLRGPMLAGASIRFAVVREEPGEPVTVAPKIKRHATGRGFYTYRDAQGKFATKEAWQAQHGRFSPAQSQVLKKMRKRDRASWLEEDTEVELSIEYEESPS